MNINYNLNLNYEIPELTNKQNTVLA